MIAGAFGAVALVIYVGRHNRSHLLQLIFVFWVLAPFATQAIADRLALHWPTSAQAALYKLTILLTMISVCAYAYGAFGPPLEKPAAIFVVVPAASWLITVVTVFMARLGSARRS